MWVSFPLLPQQLFCHKCFKTNGFHNVSRQRNDKKVRETFTNPRTRRHVKNNLMDDGTDARRTNDNYGADGTDERRTDDDYRTADGADRRTEDDDGNGMTDTTGRTRRGVQTIYKVSPV